MSEKEVLGDGGEMKLSEIREWYKEDVHTFSSIASGPLMVHVPAKYFEYLLTQCERLDMDLQSQRLDMGHCIESKQLRIEKLEEALRFYAKEKYGGGTAREALGEE